MLCCILMLSCFSSDVYWVCQICFGFLQWRFCYKTSTLLRSSPIVSLSRLNHKGCQQKGSNGVHWLQATSLSLHTKMIADKDKRDYVMFQKEMATVFVNRLRYLVWWKPQGAESYFYKTRLLNVSVSINGIIRNKLDLLNVFSGTLAVCLLWLNW